MAHIHLPDGVLPIQWAPILVVTSPRAAPCRTRCHAKAHNRNSAASDRLLACRSLFAVFHINIPFAQGVHMNLTPLIGILAG